MGLLDGLLGQVLGGMTQGRSGGFRLPGGATDGLPIPGGPFGRGGGMGGGLGGGMGGGMGSAGLGILLMLGLQLLQRNGGIEGVLGKLRDKGYAREADSWVSTGPNAQISPDALGDVFGRDQVDDLAKQLGVDSQEALGGLANVFPEIVNQVTPTGRVQSDSDDVVEDALRRLRERA